MTYFVVTDHLTKGAAWSGNDKCQITHLLERSSSILSAFKGKKVRICAVIRIRNRDIQLIRCP